MILHSLLFNNSICSFSFQVIIVRSMKISQLVPEGLITVKRVEKVYRTVTHAQLVTGAWKKGWQIMEFRLVL